MEARARVLGRALKRHNAAAKRARGELRAMLPELRAADPDRWHLRDLYELLGGSLDRGTISRWTSKAVAAASRASERAA